jgi:photosystem II stability/assembly factor-like uncharacterized protein
LGLAAHVPPLVAQSARGELFALDRDGMLAYSPDTGRHWQVLNDGANGLVVADMALVDQPDGWTLFALAESNLYRVTLEDGRASWDSYLLLSGDTQFRAVTPSPNFAFDQILALRDESGAILLVHGVNVQHREPVPWLGETLLQVAFSPTYVDDQTLCALTAQANTQGNYQVQLWRSPDNGQSWSSEAALQTEIQSVALTWPADPNERALFLATRNRVIKIYTQSANGQPASAQTFLGENVRITGLVASPQYAQDNTLFVATNQGIYQSIDQGVTWLPLGVGLEDRAIVAFFPSRDATSPTAVTLGGAVWQLGN